MKLCLVLALIQITGPIQDHSKVSKVAIIGKDTRIGSIEVDWETCSVKFYSDKNELQFTYFKVQRDNKPYCN